MPCRIIPLSIAIIIVLVLFCCNSDPPKIVDSGGNSGDTATLIESAEFVHLDTSSFILVTWYTPGNNTPYVYMPEYYLWWEKVIGEPFTDVNGNGVYDWGIDIFISSPDSTNMDLNSNGKYDGPDDPWSPGVPFDDIDGNGTARYDDPPEWDYSVGLPFCDINQNGIRDSVVPLYEMLKCIAVDTDSGSAYQYWHQKEAYSFTSDSGFAYLILPEDWFGHPLRPYTNLNFTMTDSGLIHAANILQVLMLDTGTVWADTQYVDTAWYYIHTPDRRPAEYRKTITLHQQLELEGKTFNDVLQVVWDQQVSDHSGLEGTFWEYYFTRELGFFATKFRPWSNEDVQSYYLYLRHDSLPMPMTR